jgi:hypothetical protein
VTNALAARSLDLAPDTPLTESVLSKVRDEASKPYKDISQLSPRAADALEKLKQARFEASDQYKYYNRSGNPEARKEAAKWQAKADAYEKVIEKEAQKVIDVYGVKEKPLSKSREVGFPLPATAGKHADLEAEYLGQRSAGNPDILNELRAGRTRIAKSYDVEHALGLGSGDVSAPTIARQLDKAGTAAKSGELQVIGKYADAFPQVMREGAKVPSPGVSGTDAAMSAGLGMGGYGAAGPAGILAAGLPLVRGPARAMALSDWYQNRLFRQPVPSEALGDTATRSALIADILAARQQQGVQ